MTEDKWQRTMSQPWFKHTDPMMPAYPYGKNAHFPEANYGLYGGTTIKSGSKISDGRNKGKTVRKWFPHVTFTKIRSEALDMELHIPIRSRVLRTIKKVGGLDQYLLGDKEARIKELGLLGWKLRWLVMRSPKMQAQFAAERAKYGLPREDPVMQNFEDVWKDKKTREELLAKQNEGWERLGAKNERFERHIEKWTRSDKPESRPYGAVASVGRSTVARWDPSKIELPEMIQELEIRHKSELKVEEAGT